MDLKKSKNSNDFYYEVAISEILSNKMSPVLKSKAIALSGQNQGSINQFYIILRVCELWDEEYKYRKYFSFHYILTLLNFIWNIRYIPILLFTVIIAISIALNGIFPRYSHAKNHLVLDSWTGDLITD